MSKRKKEPIITPELPEKPKSVPKIKLEDIKEIKPLTQNQELVFKYWENGYNLFLSGWAGTGKTYISCGLALKAILTEPNKYHKVVIVRSAVPGRDLGFMPGTLSEKSELFEIPYYAIFYELFKKIPNPYMRLKEQGLVNFLTTSYVRGITMNNAIIIFDELQNANFHEADSIMTRLGHNSRIIFCGDYQQSDLRYRDEKQGFHDFEKIIKEMTEFFAEVQFTVDDIVRSKLVKTYLITKNNQGIGV
jgi:phosphate starvation-inducible PhoH-like protein